MTAVDGNELYGSFPLPTGNSVRSSIPKNANELYELNIYPSNAIRIGRAKDGNLFPVAPPPGVTIIYGLTAVDTAVGRRYWESTTVDFSSAPPPIGSYILPTLTIMYKR